VSAVETPPAAQPPAPEPRRCPRCGAQLSAEQEWCLDCGAAVGTVVAAPRGWRAPFAVIGALALVALVALVLALVELAGHAEQVVPVAATPAPAGTVAPAAPGAGAAATPAAPLAKLATWPKGKTAWTVILNSSGTKDDANRLGSELAGKGIPGVGVLDSNAFESLGPDSFVVFSGQYANRALAEEALAGYRDRAGGGSTRRIVPKRSGSASG
jgi:septal ring-binding cell division protein DamX